MKSIIRIFFVIFIFGVFALNSARTASARTVDKSKFLYLFVGLDDAAGNTDVITLVSYDSGENRVAVIQLPRDTFIHIEEITGKINSLYPRFRAAGLDPDEAMRKMSDVIAEGFGVTFDGFAAITTEAFRNFIDSIGGVKIELKSDLKFDAADPSHPLVLKKGENLLSGKEAELFVRHRKSYITGDLGRLDAQKIFIDGLYRTVSEGTSFDRLFGAVRTLRRDAIADFSMSDLFSMLLRHSSKFRDAEISYHTMPGEARLGKDGIWYYILDRRASEELLAEKLFSKNEFDAKNIFQFNE